MHLKGHFIAIEGHEGTGKSTVCKELVKNLTDKGYEVVHIREPGGTEFSEEFRKVLLTKYKEYRHPMTEVLAHSAYRNQNIHNIILPALKEGKIVIAERFMFSTWALNVVPYESTEPGITELFNNIMNATMQSIPSPLLFVLEANEDVRLERLKDRVLDYYEDADPEILKSIKFAYEQLAKSPTCIPVDTNCEVSQTVDAIATIIQQMIEERSELANKVTDVADDEDVTQEEVSVDLPEQNADELIDAFIEENIVPALLTGENQSLETAKEFARCYVQKLIEQVGNANFLANKTNEYRNTVTQLHSLIYYTSQFNSFADKYKLKNTL